MQHSKGTSTIRFLAETNNWQRFQNATRNQMFPYFRYLPTPETKTANFKTKSPGEIGDCMKHARTSLISFTECLLDRLTVTANEQRELTPIYTATSSQLWSQHRSSPVLYVSPSLVLSQLTTGRPQYLSITADPSSTPSTDHHTSTLVEACLPFPFAYSLLLKERQRFPLFFVSRRPDISHSLPALGASLRRMYQVHPRSPSTLRKTIRGEKIP